MIRKLYPYGKKKVFNVTYDDGVLQDIRFVNLLNKYQLKGTFNLNSGLLENEFEWVHESGCVVKRLNIDEVKSIYEGHEIASHTLTHPYMDKLTKEEIIYELSKDKENLEKNFLLVHRKIFINGKLRFFIVAINLMIYYKNLLKQTRNLLYFKLLVIHMI